MKSPSEALDPQARWTTVLWPELAVALMSGVIFVLAHFPALANPFVINDDVRQQLFWMQQWQDPALFRGDFLTGYARHYVPWGVKALYWVASWFVAPLFFAKILPGLLFVLLAVCLFRIGTRLSDRRLGWMMVAVYWLMPFFLDNLAGGLARAFAAPLLALFWLGWQEERPWVMGTALLLQALFIPYIFLVAAPAALLAWLLARFGKDDPPPFPAHAAHFCLLGLGAALVIAMNLQFSADGYGPLVKAREMVNHPEFYAQGRYQILPEPSLLWDLASPWEFIPPFREWGPIAGGLVCMGLLALVAIGVRRLDWRCLAATAQARRVPGFGLPDPVLPGSDLPVAVICPRPVSHVYREPVLLPASGLGAREGAAGGTLAPPSGHPGPGSGSLPGGLAS